MNFINKYKLLILPFILALLFTIYSLLVEPALLALKWNENVLSNFLERLIILGGIALLVERTVEVIIGSWRQSNRVMIEEYVTYCKRRFDRMGWKYNDNDQWEIANKEFKIAENNVQAYKAKTIQYSFLLSASIGFLIAAVGFPFFRDVAITNYMDIKDINSLFRYGFVFLDITIVGGLLAGGAEGLHQFISIFTDYAGAARKNLSSNSPLATTVPFQPPVSPKVMPAMDPRTAQNKIDPG